MTKEQMIEAMTQPRELVIPVSWIITMIATLGTVVATLAHMLWTMTKERFAIQESVIKQLQDEIRLMKKGCGAGGCFWRKPIE